MTQHDRGQVLINDFELLREFLIEGNNDKLKEVLENFENFLDIEFKFKSKKGNAKVSTGNAICIACYFGHKDVVNLLISNPSFSGEVEVGKILNTYQGNIDDHDMTAIDIAASNGNTEIAKILLDNNALILNSEEDDDGADMNPFKFAALNKKLGMMNFLLNKAKDIGLSEDALKFSLTEAIENVILSFKEDIGRGDKLCDNIIKFLLDHGADTNYFSDESRTSFLNDTLEMKRYDLAYLFIQKGADIEYACKKYKHGNEKMEILRSYQRDGSGPIGDAAALVSSGAGVVAGGAMHDPEYKELKDITGKPTKKRPPDENRRGAMELLHRNPEIRSPFVHPSEDPDPLYHGYVPGKGWIVKNQEESH